MTLTETRQCEPLGRRRVTLGEVKETIEREVKLAPGEGFVLPELGGEPQPTRVFTSTYHDTDDLVLARHGVTLRHRVEGGAGVWQLKLPRGDDERIELEQPGPPARPPLELVSLLVAFLRGREIAPVTRLRTRRNVVMTDGAEIVDDSVSVMEGQRVLRRFRELEVELVGGDGRVLRRLEKQLRAAGASTGETRPKLFQALDLTEPAGPAAPQRDAPPSVALEIAFGEQARQILAHDPGTRLGSDPEELHKLRVATRRLRAFLRVARKAVDPEWSDGLRSELQWLGQALGPARDLDVLGEYLAAELETLGAGSDETRSLLDGLEAERARARLTVVEALSSDRYLALLNRLDTASTPVLTGDESPLADRWRTEWKRAKRAIAALDADSSDEELHEARIRLKKARYAAELAAHELGRRGERFGKAAAKLQDVLGAHQDAVVAEERIRAWHASAGGGDRRAARPTPARQEAPGPRRPADGVEEAPSRREAARVTVVRAAGGVPVRASADGGLEVLVVHRDQYDDWTFPKGKCDPEEPDEACAVREVAEETGLRCRLADELPSTSYVDARGRPKRVRYWRLARRGRRARLRPRGRRGALGDGRRGGAAADVRAGRRRASGGRASQARLAPGRLRSSQATSRIAIAPVAATHIAATFATRSHRSDRLSTGCGVTCSRRRSGSLGPHPTEAASRVVMYAFRLAPSSSAACVSAAWRPGGMRRSRRPLGRRDFEEVPDRRRWAGRSP